MKLITGISELVTNAQADASAPTAEVGDLVVITDAAVIIDGDRIAWSGPASEAKAALDTLHTQLAAPRSADAEIHNGEIAAVSGIETIDLGGKAVIPGFVDSHNHLIFAGDRSAEFAARMAGEKYSAGGIATTVAATRAAGDEELEANLVHLLDQATRQGTTTFEVKSGYGLTLDDEIRALEIIRRHTPESTLMAAHVIPPEHKADPETYVSLIIDEIIPASVGTAKWIDVFCETGAFDEDQTRRIIDAGKAAGLLPRLHANQLTEAGRCASARSSAASPSTTRPSPPMRTSPPSPRRAQSSPCCPASSSRPASPTRTSAATSRPE